MDNDGKNVFNNSLHQSLPSEADFLFDYTIYHQGKYPSEVLSMVHDSFLVYIRFYKIQLAN